MSPGHQAAVDEEALAARGVPGGVDQLDPHVAHRDHVAAVVGHQLGRRDAGRPLDPGHLVALDVDRDVDGARAGPPRPSID